MRYKPGQNEESQKVETGCWVECAEPATGRISALSPLGAALLGHIPGDSVEFVAHRAARTVRILKVIPTLPAQR